jgi:hypothetical protein
MGVDYYMPPSNLKKVRVRNEEGSTSNEENQENVNPAMQGNSGTQTYRANAPDSLVALYGVDLVASIYNTPFYQNLPL